MLRLILVFSIIAVGFVAAFGGPFNILLFYLWNAYFRPEQWVWTDYVTPLRLSFVAAIALLLTSGGYRGNLRIRPLIVLVGLFFLQSIVSLAVSVDYNWSLRFWVDFAKVMVVALLMTVLVTDLDRFRKVFLVVGYSLGFEAAKQGWAQLVLNPGAPNNNPHPALGDNNGVGMGMMMLLPFFVALTQTARPRWERALHRFFIVGLAYRGLSTYSRGAFLSAAVLGCMMLWRSPRKFRAVIAVGVLSTALLSVMPDAFWDRMSTISADSSERESSAASRLHFWGVAVDMASAKPLTGVGFNAYRRAFATYDPEAAEWGEDRAVHSAWFGALAEMGYPGLVLLVLTLCFALVTCSRIRSQYRRVAPDLVAYATALQASLVSFAVGATFLNGQYNEMFWHLIGLTIALQNCASRIANVSQHRTRCRNR